MHDLLDATRHARVQLDIGPDPNPIDVVVQVWLHDPDILGEVHQMHQLDRPRGFVHFVTDRSPVPAFEEPTGAQKQDLEAELAEWFYNAKRGRYARVWMASASRRILVPGAPRSDVFRNSFSVRRIPPAPPRTPFTFAST
jgi:hypothetical protein